MDIIKGTPYFTQNVPPIKQSPYLNKDHTCDVLIVGGGIDGAICAYFLSKSGINVTLVDKNRFGFCSSSSATALLEYQLDEHAQDLEKYLTKQEIVTSYNLGLQELSNIDTIIKTLGNKCYYSPRPTLVYTQKATENKQLENEYQFRIQNNFNAQLIKSNTNPYCFKLESGIYCENGGAQFNPYLFTKQMINNSNKQGAKLYENTEIVKLEYDLNGVIAYTNYGYKIKCKKVICATGYNTTIFSEKDLCEKYCSYTIVTNPIKNFSWLNNTLLHDNTDPYHYIRLSHDNRIILGGEDTKITATINANTAEKKYKLLADYMLTLFPQIKNNYTIDYKFCGYFGTTLNNLAIIGPQKQNPHLWFMLGYGANGIINSIIGAQMLTDLYYGKVHRDMYVVSPDRQLV